MTRRRPPLRSPHDARGSGIFVTGVDTDVGKTEVAALLSKELVSRGCRVGVHKPVASGCFRQANGSLLSFDAERLWRAADQPWSLDRVCPLRFEAPLAPGTAARLEGSRFDLETLLGNARSLELDCELLLVEGAGGLLSPLGDDFDNRDLGAALGYPGLIVASNRLGAINQVRMTIECWQHGPTRSLPILGVVLSDTSSEQSLVMQTNLTDVGNWLADEQIPICHLGHGSSELPGDFVSQILRDRLIREPILFRSNSL